MVTTTFRFPSPPHVRFGGTRIPVIFHHWSLSVETSREAWSGGRHETVTLTKETSTPRARSLTATFKRVITPEGESQPAKRQRKKK